MIEYQQVWLVLGRSGRLQKGQWHLLMPDCVRESLSTSYSAYLDMAEKGVKAPSAKELRMMAALQRYMGAKNNYNS